jgi:hypothetical protein
MRRAQATAAILVVLAAGCGPALVWRKPGGDEAQLRRDDHDCRRRAEDERWVPTIHYTARGRGMDQSIQLAPQTTFDYSRFQACMEDLGYRQVPREEGRP